MAIPCYLAMTAAEYAACSVLPSHIGWMACHFSLQNNGLSNLPQQLPANALLILDDSIPMENHSIDAIVSQLTDAAQEFQIDAVLLDFQRLGIAQEKELAAGLGAALPCPVAAPAEYAVGTMPIFLPPVPLNKPIRPYISQHSGQELWLDAAPTPIRFRITSDYSICESLSSIDRALPLADTQAHCHYEIQLSDTCATFTLGRSKEDFSQWLQDAEALGITRVVGLYQEFTDYDNEKAAL